MDVLYCTLRQATHFQSMELERAEAICGFRVERMIAVYGPPEEVMPVNKKSVFFELKD